MPLWGQTTPSTDWQDDGPVHSRDLQAELRRAIAEIDTVMIGDRNELAYLKEQYAADLQDQTERIATDKARETEIKTKRVERKAK